MRVHVVGMRQDVADWGVALFTREAGLLAWLTPEESRRVARELEQMATITEAPAKVPGE